MRTVAGASWKVANSYLTAGEARQPGDWLRAAADGRVPVTEAPTEDSEETFMCGRIS